MLTHIKQIVDHMVKKYKASQSTVTYSEFARQDEHKRRICKKNPDICANGSFRRLQIFYRV